MATDQTEGAVNQVENKVAATGDVHSPQVADEVNAALTSPNNGKIINNADMTQAFATRLENEGILPSMVIDQLQAGNLNQWKTGENLDRAKVEAAANDPNNQSPLNRMMAQAILKRFKDLDTTPGDGLSLAELNAWVAKPTTSEDGSTVYRDTAGRPVRIVHPTADGQPPQETLIKRDAQGNPTQIIPPPGSGAIPLEIKDGKWQVTNAPDPSSEITNVVVLPDGTYKFDTKKTNGSDAFTVTQKTDLSRVFTAPNGNVFQVDRNIADLRSFKATPRDNPNVITLNEGKTTLKLEGDPPLWKVQGKPDEVYSSITAAPDGTVTMTRPDKTATVYNTDRSVVALDANGQPQSIKYANGKESQFQYENGQLARIVENGVSRPLTAGAVDRGGNYSYNQGDQRFTVHSTGKVSQVKLEAAAPVEPAPVQPVPADVGTGGSKIEVSADGTITRTNAGGSETETITKSGDRYTIVRKGQDGSTNTEFAKAGTFKPEMKDGKMVGYSYTTEGGAEVKQNADGSREYKDPSGATTKYTYDAEGKVNKIEHTGKGGVTETLTRGANNEWSISRPDNSAGGKVDAVRINADGSYSYAFMGTVNTQETQRNIREEKRPNGDSMRIGFDNEGKPEFVVRNYTVDGAKHQEQLKMTDGKWQVTVDGKPVDAKDIKVYPGGGYEYTRNSDGTKYYQDGNTRRETRADGSQVESTTLPSGDTQNKTTLTNGDSHAVITSPQGVLKSIVHTSKESGKTETISFNEKGEATGLVVSETANPNNKVEAKNFKYDKDKGSYSYDLPLDPNNPDKVRHVEQNMDGSRKEVSREPYVVQGGDFLYKLAKQRGVSVQDIIDAQPDEIRARLTKNPNLILKGETLIMPSDKKDIAAPAAVAPPESKPESTPASGEREDYTVKPGDSLTKIATARGTNVDALIAEIKGFDPELGKRLEQNRNLIISGEKLPLKKRPAK